MIPSFQKNFFYFFFVFCCIINCTNRNEFAFDEGKGSNTNEIIRESVSVTDSFNRKAIFEWEQGNYQKAMEYILLAYKRVKLNKDEKKTALILNTMGLIQWQLNNNEDAMQSYDASAQIAKKYQMYRLLGLTHTNRSLIHKEKNNINLAFFHNEQAIEIFKQSKHYRDLAIVLNNQGQIFKRKGLIDSARVYYLRALDNYKKVDYKDGAAATYYNLSEILMRQNQKQTSIKAAFKSLKLATESQSKIRIIEAYKRLAETYEYFDNPDSALYYFKHHNSHYNKLLITNQSSTLAKHQAEMGAEVKTLKIQNLLKEKELASNRFWFIVVGIFIIFLFLAFLIYRKLVEIKFKKKSLERELVNSKKILNIKELELKSYILDLSKKNNLIDKLQNSLKIYDDTVNNDKILELLDQKILTEDDWIVFKSKFINIYPSFLLKMKQYEIQLTEAEIRYMVLLRLDLSSKEMAKILGISSQSVRVCKMRLKKKLQRRGFKTVENYLRCLLNE